MLFQLRQCSPRDRSSTNFFLMLIGQSRKLPHNAVCHPRDKDHLHPMRKTLTSSMAYFRQSYQNVGIPKYIAEFMSSCRRLGTRKQAVFPYPQRMDFCFCLSKLINPNFPSLDLLDKEAKLFTNLTRTMSFIKMIRLFFVIQSCSKLQDEEITWRIVFKKYELFFYLIRLTSWSVDLCYLDEFWKFFKNQE